MGLDMYLSARAFASEYYDPANIYSQVKDLLPDLPPSSTFTVEKEVAYWRKANAIHGWFVRNCQDGNDDCKDYWVSAEQLQELHDLCAGLLVQRSVQRALDELPPQEGFFFGGREIDEWYWADLEATVSQLGALLGCPTINNYDLYYRSSW